MSQSLKAKALSGVIWLFVGRGAQQIIRFGVTVVMARLLAPEIFGLVAMLQIFTFLAQKFIYSGFGGALIQKKNVTQTDESTLFWYNLGVAAIVYCILFLVAPYVAEFYAQEELTAILRVSALGLLIGAFNIVHGVRFAREMDFRTPTIASLAGTLAMGASGIAFALQGFGVWSLVFSNLVRRTTTCVVLWAVARWRPTLEFSKSSMQQIARFGVPVLSANLLNGFVSNLHTVFIGRYFAVSDLGFFNRGRAIQSIAVQTSSGPLIRVLFPSFSKLQNDRVRLGKAYLKVLRVVSFVLAPILFALASCSDSLVLFVYGERWLPSAPYLFWLSLFGIWLPLSTIGFSVFKSLGEGSLYLRLSLVRHLWVVVGIVAGLQFGIIGIIVGMGVAQAFVFFTLGVALRTHLALPWTKTFMVALPSILSALGAFIAAMSLPLAQGMNGLFDVLLKCAVFALCFGVFVYIARLRALAELAEILNPYLGKVPSVGGRITQISNHIIARTK